MNDGRLVRHCVLLMLPTAALMLLGAYFLVRVVPNIVANERAGARSASKEAVEQLKDGMIEPDFRWIYEKGVEGGGAFAEMFPAETTWKEWDAKGQVGKAQWGWRETPGGRIVWVRVDKSTVLGKATGISETDYAFWLWTVCPALMAALLCATVFAVRRLLEYAKLRDDFLAAAAHDLCTPLVGMRYMIGRDDAEAANLNERMLRIVDNISDFLSHGGRRKSPRPEPFRLRDAFDAAYRIFAADYEEETSGPVKTAGDMDVCAYADEELTTQILWNLLGNDLKYAAPFGPVCARFANDGGFAVMQLVDEGGGMTDAEMKKAFDRYWRAKTVLKTGKGGFGIGLCTSRECARSMGGDLSVEANGTKGCVFTLKLPACAGRS